MERLVHRWKRLPAAVRKPLVLISGSLIVLIGILLVPLPGPGWVVVFGGLTLLATEFAAAQKLRDWTIRKIKGAASKIKTKLETKSHDKT